MHPGLHPAAENNRNDGQNDRKSDRVADDLPDVLIERAEIFQRDRRDNGRGQRAQAQPLDNVPVHIFFHAVRNSAGAFGDRGEGQIGTHGHGWIDPEQQGQQRRHQ